MGVFGMEKIKAWKQSFTIDGKDYAIIMFETSDIVTKCYDLCIDSSEEPLKFMFRIPQKNLGIQEAINIGIANAHDYISPFEE